MKQKHYMDIQVMKSSFVDGFSVGDHVMIQEKIDGANFSIRYDADENIIRAYSRKKELDPMNNLRGAFEWSQKLDVDLVKDALGNNLVLFGEWMVKHTILYPDSVWQNAWFYDVYDTEKQKYLNQEKVKNIVAALELNYIPVFYDGAFQSWDHVKSFVGETKMGGEVGEGIVVKNLSRMNDPNTRLPFYTKIVGEKFRETKGRRESKPTNIEKLKERERLSEIVETVVTRARVEKLVNKMVDEGIIPEDWSNSEMGTIAKNIGKNVYYDCVKEEPDVVNEVGEMFGKLANGLAMKIVRDMLAERNGAF